jgi:hypothetical protein
MRNVVAAIAEEAWRDPHGAMDFDEFERIIAADPGDLDEHERAKAAWRWLLAAVDAHKRRRKTKCPTMTSTASIAASRR